jgi:hypothetical protein
MRQRSPTGLLSIAAVIRLLGSAGDAAAYVPNAAAAYADQYWNHCGTLKYPCFSNDCTNFVSQAIRAGGYPLHCVGCDTNDDHNWYIQNVNNRIPPIWQYSDSWSYAQNLRNILILDVPGGYTAGTYPGTSTLANPAGGKGDVFFYDWDSISETRPIDHASINVGYGSTDDNKYGDFVDSHTNNRHHAFWTLATWNNSKELTVIYSVRISSSN